MEELRELERFFSLEKQHNSKPDQFQEWKDTIEKRLSSEAYDYFYTGEEKKLLSACKKHAKGYKAKVEDEAICLVHPFYLYMQHSSRLKEDTRSEAEEYLQRVKQVVDKRAKPLIVMETAQHYALFTHKLLEQKMIDEVIFTNPITGTIEHSQNIRRFRRKKFHVGGSYARGFGTELGCLNTGILSLKTRDIRTAIVPEICLNAPENYQRLLDPPSFNYPIESTPMQELVYRGY